jgi:mono/diheme cytochrome c family protein
VPTFTQFPISRQGLQDIALFLIAGMAIFGALAAWRRYRGGDVRRQLTSVGILGVLVVITYVLAFTVAPNIPTPPVPFTARFQNNPTPDTTESIDRGRQVFLANCAICHGARALGDGPQAFLLNPRPFNLQLHVPQHATGEIFYWIRNGVVGTAMPSWKDALNTDGTPKLTEEDTWKIIRFLDALAAKRIEQ